MNSQYKGYAWPEQDKKDILPGFLQDVQECGARSILDIGCGDGWLTEILAKDTEDVLGIDSDPEMITKASNGKRKARYQVMHAEDVDTVAREFDLAVSTLALQMLGEESVLESVFSKIPSSRVIAVVPHPSAIDKNESYARFRFSDNFSYLEGGSYNVWLDNGNGGIEFPSKHLPLCAYVNAAVKGNFQIENVREYGGKRFPYFLQLNLRRAR